MFFEKKILEMIHKFFREYTQMKFLYHPVAEDIYEQ